MKKTVTANLNGFVYQIDEDAYSQLQEYLDSIKQHLVNEESNDEILADIEARIAELFNERIKFGSLQVMTIKEVDEIIATLGHPEEFEIEPDNEPTGSEGEPVAEETKESRNSQKRLYRNVDEKMIGGVCSGLAERLGIDLTLVRILFIILLIFWGSTFWLYIIMWLIVPPATSAAQKLEMRGEEPNVENIKRFIQDTADRGAEAFSRGIDTIRERNFFQKVFDFFGEVFTAVFKLLFGILGGCLGCLGFLVIVPVVFGLTVGLLGLIVHPMTWNMGLLQTWWDSNEFLQALTTPNHLAMAILAGLMVIGIPILTCLYALIAAIFKLPQINKVWGWAIFAVWIIGIVVSAVFASVITKNAGLLI